MERITRDDLPGLFRKWREVFATQRDFLIALDGHLGDSDLGITMNKGFAAASEAVDADPSDSLGKTFQAAGMALARAAPSTMGTLVATGMMRAGKALAGKDAMAAPELCIFWQTLRDSVAERGKAKLGDKTVLDVLAPVADSFEASASQNVPLKESLKRATAAAASGLDLTKSMIAQHGKAAVFQEKSRGHQDAGATVGFLMVQAVLDYVEGAS